MLNSKSRLGLKTTLMYARLSVLLVFAGCINNDCDPKASLSGVVARADNPNIVIPNAQIMLYSANGTGAVIKTTQSDANGTYTIDGIRENDYTLVILVSDGGYHQAQILVRARKEGSKYNIYLTPSHVEVDRIEIISPPPDGINGSYSVGNEYLFRARIINAHGQELAGWQPMWRVEGGVGTIDRFGRFKATSAGEGEIVAYLLRGTQIVQARVPVRVRERSGTQGNAWLLVPFELASGGYGLRAYDTRSRQVRRDYPLSARSRPEGLSLSPDGIAYWIDQSSRTVYRIDLSTGQTSAFSLGHSARHVLALPNDLLVVVRSPFGEDRFYLYDGRSGALIEDYQRLAVTTTYSMALGPDGRIYIACRYRENQRSYYGIVRYRLEGSTFVLDRVLTQGTAIPRGIAFAANGDMIVSEGRVLQRYTSEGTLLGDGFALPRNDAPEIIHFGRGVLQPFDEVLFVQTDKGIWRVRYDGSRFSLVSDDAGTYFLPGRYGNCLVWNR